MIMRPISVGFLKNDSSISGTAHKTVIMFCNFMNIYYDIVGSTKSKENN
jgi:hypothetical protein